MMCSMPLLRLGPGHVSFAARRFGSPMIRASINAVCAWKCGGDALRTAAHQVRREKGEGPTPRPRLGGGGAFSRLTAHSGPLVAVGFPTLIFADRGTASAWPAGVVPTTKAAT
jgi:hypothetical protein